ncbi:hypothetical protein ACFVH0_16410 [Streptomyces sp. NPDC127117]|uniref:hypothetical protein n=1 Tax=Streptomyces sp. NPDC127117 TaxID=3345368 RepID=UPI0036270D41
MPAATASVQDSVAGTRLFEQVFAGHPGISRIRDDGGGFRGKYRRTAAPGFR